MLEAIRKAQHTVDLMTFVYWKGWPAQQFADALCDRAKAGLRVRVLIDALGGIQIEDGIVEAMEDSGVDVHWYRKLWLNSPFKQNHRGHRKVCIIDETIGFTGGVGIAEEWEGDARNKKEWRDTHFRVEGPAVDGLAAAFIQDWAETGHPSTTSVTASLNSRNLVWQRFRSCVVRPASAGTTSARSGTCSSVPPGTGSGCRPRTSHPTRTWSPRSRRLSAEGSAWTSCCRARMRTNASRS